MRLFVDYIATKKVIAQALSSMSAVRPTSTRLGRADLRCDDPAGDPRRAPATSRPTSTPATCCEPWPASPTAPPAPPGRPARFA
ncbi:MAG: hypothetical protein WDM85_15565 [Caulobacteraceae bacterium]